MGTRKLALSITTLASVLLTGTVTPALAMTKERVVSLVQGYSEILRVAEPADLNGDGYSDVVVGNYSYDGGGQTDRGLLYIFFGGPTLPRLAQMTIQGELTNDALGLEMATLDYNVDGYDDIVALRWGRDDAVVFYGGPNFDATPDLTITGGALGTADALVGIGDIDGDGDGDFAIADYSNEFIHIYEGGAFANSTPDQSLPNQDPGSAVGKNMAAGDFDGDGRRDLVASNTTNLGTSYVYLFTGRNGGNLQFDSQLSTYFYGDEFGYRLLCPGDMDADGDDELLIASKGEDEWEDHRLYYYEGGRTNWSSPAYLEEGGTFFPTSIRWVGDVDRDGRDDVLIEDKLYFGRDNGFPTNPTTLTLNIDAFGIGDPNGDGFQEVIAGEWPNGAIYSLYSYKIEQPWSATTWIAGTTATVGWKGADIADIDLSTDGGTTWNALASGVGGSIDNLLEVTVPNASTTTAQIRITRDNYSISRSTSARSELFAIRPYVAPPAASAELGISVAGQTVGGKFALTMVDVGDVNADGHPDLLVGARLDDTAGTSAGAAYVYFGGPDMDPQADLTILGNPGDFFGHSVGAAGDANGDGFDDFLVGAIFAAGGDGRAYLYFGGPGVDATADVTFSSDDGDPHQFGSSVSGIGDATGNGYSDVGVGNPYGDESLLIFEGGPGIENSVYDYGVGGGNAVVAIGDVNGDGGDDYASADLTRNTVGVRQTPLAYGIDNVLTIVGSSNSDFGFAICGGEDLNGDGIDDLAVGAPLDDHAGTDAGRVSIYFGGRRSFDGEADLEIFGASALDQLGTSVCLVPDLNGDGHVDLVIGSPESSVGGSSSGRVQVHFGGPLLDDRADIVIDGTAGIRLGTSVAGFQLDNAAWGSLFAGAPTPAEGRIDRYDFDRYHLLAPSDGAVWNVGAEESVLFTGSEPANIYLSLDAGGSRHLLATHVGGEESNAVAIQVPHMPTRFARLILEPARPGVAGEVSSTGLFTVETSIALLFFRLDPVDDGVHMEWQTEPGSEAGIRYRVERREAQGGWTVVADRLSDAEFIDISGTPASEYRLTAINGLDGELVLGTETIHPAVALGAGPLPFSGGELTVSFVALALPGQNEEIDLSIYDITGRRLVTLTNGRFESGQHELSWNGRDAAGRKLSSGIYLLRLVSEDRARTLKLAVR